MRGHVQLLTEQDRRFAVVYVDDQSEHARMEATRRDFVANVSHELETPVGAMGVLAEALLASADDPDTVRRFAEKMLTESNRLANVSICADIGQAIESLRQACDIVAITGSLFLVGEAMQRLGLTTPATTERELVLQ